MYWVGHWAVKWDLQMGVHWAAQKAVQLVALSVDSMAVRRADRKEIKSV